MHVKWHYKNETIESETYYSGLSFIFLNENQLANWNMTVYDTDLLNIWYHSRCYNRFTNISPFNNTFLLQQYDDIENT